MSCNLIQLVAALANSGVIGQPNLSQVVYLCHFDALATATTVTDATNKTWSLKNGATITNSNPTPKFGAGAMVNNTNYSAQNTYTGAALGTGDFTVEMWIYPTSMGAASPAVNGLFNLYVANQNTGLHLTFGQDGTLNGGNNATHLVNSPSGTIKLNQWQHVAFTRQGTLLSLWVNGTRVGTSQMGGSMNVQTNTATVGWSYVGNASQGYFIGFTDEFRLVRGMAVYTENFTPANQPFTMPTA